MCLIIHKPANVELTKGQLEPVFRKNGDGFGLMFLDEDLSVKVEKILPKSIDECMDLLNKYASLELGIHFRMKTHGTISIDNVHPYKIFTREEGAPFDAYLMHNGVLSTYTANTAENSDTYNFIDQFIKPLIEADGPEIVNSSTFQTLLDEVISSGNRLLLLTNKGFKIINEGAGNTSKIPGVWCSNTYAFASEVTHSNSNFRATSYGTSWSNPINRPWGTLPGEYNTSVPSLFKGPLPPKQEEAKEMDKETPKTPPKIESLPEVERDLETSYMPGIGDYSYQELEKISDGLLFTLIVEHPEDVFDMFSDYMPDIIDAISNRIYEEAEPPEVNRNRVPADDEIELPPDPSIID